MVAYPGSCRLPAGATIDHPSIITMASGTEDASTLVVGKAMKNKPRRSGAKKKRKTDAPPTHTKAVGPTAQECKELLSQNPTLEPPTMATNLGDLTQRELLNAMAENAENMKAAGDRAQVPEGDPRTWKFDNEPDTQAMVDNYNQNFVGLETEMEEIPADDVEHWCVSRLPTSTAWLSYNARTKASCFMC